ncbi:hypothetical protein [Nioella sp.]|uniref:hypothetical protein n=1 Tax=Nioella sp. TaxID=1912091 RepID=UPI003A84049E
MMRIWIAGLALLATPLSAQTAPGDLLGQAMLLGPARMEDAGGSLTIFGEAGTASYVAMASGPDCSSSGSNCSTLSFQAVAPPPSGGDAAADWQASGLGGSVSVGGDGWLVLSHSASAADPAAAFQAWGGMMQEFSARFGN